MVVSRVHEYEIGEELFRTAMGIVAVVRSQKGSSGAPRVIKLFQPILPGIGGDANGVEAFLQRVRVQHDVSKSGALHWAPIHDFGRIDDGAFFVTDLYPRSLQKLVNGRVILGGAELFGVIHAIVEGLSEIKRSAGRGHGALKPGNVLISGAASFNKTQIVLSDPTGESPDGESHDLSSLGELIHQLVTQRRFSGAASWPLSASAEWGRLGSRGDGWRTLCNSLLDPMPTQAFPSLEDVVHSVRRLRPGKTWIPIASGCVVVGAVAAAALGMAHIQQQNKTKFDADRESWFGPLATVLVSEQSAGKLDAGNDSSLITLTEKIQQQELAHLQLPAPVPYKPDFTSFRQSRQAVSVLDSVPNRLNASQWKRLGKVEQLCTACRECGFEQPAQSIESLTSHCTTIDGSTADAVRCLLETSSAALEQLQNAVDYSRSIDSALNGAGAVDQDDFLRRFSENLKSAAAAGRAKVQFSTSGCTGLETLRLANSRAQRFAKTIEQARAAGWPGGLEKTSFAADVESPLLNAPLIDAALSQWLQSIGDYVAQPVPRDSIALINLRDRLAALEKKGPDAPSYLGSAKHCQQQIDNLSAMRFTRKQLAAPDSGFAVACADVNASLESLDTYGQKLNSKLQAAQGTETSDSRKSLQLVEDLLGVDAEFKPAVELKGRLEGKLAAELKQQLADDLDKARQFASAGALDDAQLSITAALTIDANNKDALALRDQLNKQAADQSWRKSEIERLLAQAAAESPSKPYDALKSISRLHELGGENPTVANLRASILQKLLAAANAEEAAGNHDGALSDLAQLIQVAPDDAEATARQASILQQRQLVNQQIAQIQTELTASPERALPLILELRKTEANNPAIQKLQHDAEPFAAKKASQLADAGQLETANALINASLQLDGNQPELLLLQKNIASRMAAANVGQKIAGLLAKSKGEMANAPAVSLADAKAVLTLDKKNEAALELKQGAIKTLLQNGDAYAARGTDASFKDAAWYYKQASDEGNDGARVKLADILLHGRGVPQDYATGLSLLQKAQPDMPDQAYRFGMMCEESKAPSAGKDAAEYFYGPAARAGDSNAMRRVAAMYLSGDGVAQDPSQAFPYFQQLAQSGDVDAMVQTGVCCRQGLGTSKDPAAARTWFERAAAQNNVRAMTNLAEMYDKGDGIPADAKLARQWYQKAADAGDGEARAWLDSHKVAAQTPSSGHKKPVLVP